MMRAAIGIYEHPDNISSSDVWSKGDSIQASSESSVGSVMVKALGGLSLAAAASTLVVLRYTTLGDILRERYAAWSCRVFLAAF